MKTVSVIALICGACGAAAADGMMVPTKREWNQRMERAYIQEPAQKAFIHFAAGRERLIISPSFRGDAADFAWRHPLRHGLRTRGAVVEVAVLFGAYPSVKA